MKVLLNICHPAHVHFYKNFIRIMQSKGHKFYIFARNKDISFKLLEANNIDYIVLGKHHKKIYGKLFSYFIHIMKLLYYSIYYNVDILLDSGPFYLAPVSLLTRKPYVIANNTDANFALSFSKYFGTYYIHNLSFTKYLGKRQIKIDSINELSFLHPKYFKPDSSILKKLNMDSSNKLILLRFVSWNSVDDIGKSGYTIEEIRCVINSFEKFGKILISSEYKLPDDLAKYRLEDNQNIPYGSLQNIEAISTLFFGESGAMASECAMLGVPSFYVSSKKLGFTEELEQKYGLVHNFQNKEKALENALNLLKNDNLTSIFESKRIKLLQDKISYTDFLVWYVESFPVSFDTMKKNPDYQYIFK